MALLYHFHLLISVKESKDITHEVGNKKEQTLKQTISFQFRKFFTSYAMSINLQKNRTGSLFQKSFKMFDFTVCTFLRLQFLISN